MVQVEYLKNASKIIISKYFKYMNEKEWQMYRWYKKINSRHTRVLEQIHLANT